jgi:hypothetical protein
MASTTDAGFMADNGHARTVEQRINTSVQVSSDKEISSAVSGSTAVGSPGADEKYFENDKPGFLKDTTTVQVHDLEGGQSQHLVESSWKPTLLRAGPISGILALGLGVLQIVASYLILALSDGQPISSWRYQPSVYLAVLAAISNKAIAFAAIQGVVITFWTSAIKGTTFGQLHRNWSYGFHAYNAVFAGKRFNVLALACLCTTLVGQYRTTLITYCSNTDSPNCSNRRTTSPKSIGSDIRDNYNANRDVSQDHSMDAGLHHRISEP